MWLNARNSCESPIRAALYMPAEVFSPGEYLRDELAERCWTDAQFAEIAGLSPQAVSAILGGELEITNETALAFSRSFGTTPELWLNLQQRFKQDHRLRR